MVDAHAVVRHGLARLLEDPLDLELVGQAASADDARELVGRKRPHVVILGLNLPKVDALELIPELRGEEHGPRILVFGVYDETLFAERCLRLGASGYVRRDAAPEELLRAVRTVLGEGVYVCDRARKHILARLAEGHGKLGGSPLSHLTDRELQVFRLLGDGRSTREIAELLGLSIKTIETHRAKLMKKLGIDNATQLLQRAVEWTHRERTGQDPAC